MQMKTLFWKIVCFFRGHDFVYAFDWPVKGFGAVVVECKHCGRIENLEPANNREEG
jgi:hypothetical protein